MGVSKLFSSINIPILHAFSVFQVTKYFICTKFTDFQNFTSICCSEFSINTGKYVYLPWRVYGKGLATLANKLL